MPSGFKHRTIRREGAPRYKNILLSEIFMNNTSVHVDFVRFLFFTDIGPYKKKLYRRIQRADCYMEEIFIFALEAVSINSNQFCLKNYF